MQNSTICLQYLPVSDRKKQLFDEHLICIEYASWIKQKIFLKDNTEIKIDIYFQKMQ
jgi:hypothetical protein